MDQIYFVVAELVPMRITPSEKVEMVSQLLFGEWVTVIASEGSYHKVKSWEDQYLGWVDAKMIAPLPEPWQAPNRWRRISAAHEEGKRITPKGEFPLLLTRGCRIPVQEGGGPGQLELQAESLDFQGISVDADTQPSGKSVIHEARKYLGAPYLWGGRSLYGIDCSGLTQLAFAFTGRNLPRDAWQQANQGDLVGFSEIAEGDLAFFSRDGRIVHVGVSDGSGGIIHASGMVRWDELTAKGIQNHQTGILTHELSLIKRFP